MADHSRSALRVVFGHSISVVVRDRTVAILAVLFLILVMISSYLGWSATTTVNAIYQSASAYLTSQSQPVPPNPVLDTSPLSLLRNMATYVSLIGALAAIVVGYQLIATDRKAGIMPLVGSRPVERRDYAFGKLAALFAVIAALLGFAALVSVGTILVLPAISLAPQGWMRLVAFFGVSGLYMLIFGLLGLASAAKAKSESVGLLVPITAWLSFTFVLPQLTSNINPVAALNPVTALSAPPSSAFFEVTGFMLGPLSLAEAFRTSAAQLLDFLPPDFVERSAIGPLVSLLIAGALLLVVAHAALARVDMANGDYNA